MNVEFPSWHLIESETGFFSAHLFLSERQYSTDISEEHTGTFYSIDDCIDECLMIYDAIVYEVNYHYDPIRILHDPKFY